MIVSYFGSEFVMFLRWPFVYSSFSDYVDGMYADSDHSVPEGVFIFHMGFLRMAVPLLLLRFMFQVAPQWVYSEPDHVRFTDIISPSVFQSVVICFVLSYLLCH